MENSKQDVYAGLSFSEPEAGHIVSSIHTYGRDRNLVQGGGGIRGHHYKSCLQSMMTVPVPVTKSGNTAESSPRLCTCVPNISEELLKRTPVRDLSAS